MAAARASIAWILGYHLLHTGERATLEFLAAAAPVTGPTETGAEIKYRLLLEIAHKVSGTLNLHEVPGHLIDTIRSAIPYQAAEVFLEPGDTLILYTDGVIKAADKGGEEYGQERLRAAIRNGSAPPAGETIRAVIAETRAFSGSEAYLDDFTLVILRRLRT